MTMTEQPAANPAEQAVLDHLTGLGISFSRFTHPPVFTVEEAERYWADIPATHCKNLFLRNAKGTRHYLVVLEHAKNRQPEGPGCQDRRRPPQFRVARSAACGFWA